MLEKFFLENLVLEDYMSHGPQSTSRPGTLGGIRPVVNTELGADTELIKLCVATSSLLSCLSCMDVWALEVPGQIVLFRVFVVIVLIKSLP